MGVLTYLGNKTVGDAIPLLQDVLKFLDLPGKNGRLAALIRLSASITPPTISGSAKLAAKIIAHLNVAVSPPALAFNLGLAIDPLQLAISFALQLAQIMAAAGVALYSYQGKQADFGSDVAAQLTGPAAQGIPLTDDCFAIVLLVDASAGATTQALKGIFKVG